MACITFAFCFIMGTKKSYLQSLGSLQLLAIVMVVVGHFGFTDNAFMNSLGVGFCFVYSGFFTALHHRFDSSYGLKGHCRFMLNKLIKLYPLHLLAIALNIIVMWRNGMIHDVSLKVLFYHLTLLSSWIPIDDYYFGYNPVAWYICSLFFLYLMAPVVVRLLRRIPVAPVAAGVTAGVAAVTAGAILLIGGHNTNTPAPTTDPVPAPTTEEVRVAADSVLSADNEAAEWDSCTLLPSADVQPAAPQARTHPRPTPSTSETTTLQASDSAAAAVAAPESAKPVVVKKVVRRQQRTVIIQDTSKR